MVAHFGDTEFAITQVMTMKVANMMTMSRKAFERVFKKLPTVFLESNKEDIKILENLVERATPMRPHFCDEEWGNEAYCPNKNCGDNIESNMSYCPNCGQRLNWEFDDD